jgi:YfiH family protein
MQKQIWLKSINKTALNSKAIQQPDWPVRNVLAFTTSRLYPIEHANSVQRTLSNKSFDHFNLGDHVGDDLTLVNHNRQALHAFLPENTHIQWLKQVHGEQVLTLSQENISSSIPLEADAVITREKKIALSIMTADCLPILLASKSGDEVAAIHGGWRPLSLGIIKRTLDNMQTPNDEVYAWLGPCIGHEAFEVGVEVQEAFIKMSLACENAFKLVKGPTTKYLADLHLLATLLLNHCGVTNISLIAHCTFSQAEQYYSYRRDGQTGRMATLICLS